MADWLELRSYSGRLFYAPPSRFSVPDLPTGYFRPRVPRPHTLHIAYAPADRSKRHLAKPKLKVLVKLLSDKLATPKDNAKRFFRFVTSSQTPNKLDPSGIGPAAVHKQYRWSAISSVSTTPSVTPNLPDMTSGDGGRNGRARGNSGIGGPISGILHRPTLSDEVRTASDASIKSITSEKSASGIFGDEKPIASGNGVSVSISLAEPVLFLQGFDQADITNRTTTLLRGSLRLRVSKSAKIKAITLAFRGRANTEWPEGVCWDADKVT